MNLFEKQSCKFSVKDIVELKSGFDMHDIYSKCRVWLIDAGLVKVAPWQATEEENLAEQSVWLTIECVERKYRKIGIAR